MTTFAVEVLEPAGAAGVAARAHAFGRVSHGWPG